MPKPGRTGLRRVVDATRYSAQGFRAAWRNESAFRQETTLALILVPFAFLLGGTRTQIALLLLTLGLVLITELLNSAIEAIVDHASPELNELAGRAKDMGSAAVFVSLTTVVVVWALVAVDRFG
jgi:diacylglycerol kinase (ATP)